MTLVLIAIAFLIGFAIIKFIAAAVRIGWTWMLQIAVGAVCLGLAARLIIWLCHGGLA